MLKKALLLILAVLLSALVATFTEVRVDDAFLNTIYTLAGIMFSIGMGVVCAFNPERIKNNSYLQQVRSDIVKVRGAYIHLFTASSILYLAHQLFPKTRFEHVFMDRVVAVDLPSATIAVCIVGIIYYIANFLAVQKLNFEITDKINSEAR